MRAFDVLLFDLGNTLMYFEGDWQDVFARADSALSASLESQGVILDNDAFRGEFRARMDAYFKERETEFIEYTAGYILRSVLEDFGYPDIPREILDGALEAMFRVSQAHWHPEPDLHSTLAALRGDGYRLGAVSNAADDANVQALVDKAGIRYYFDYIISSAATGIRKPDPRIFKMALGALDCPPGRAAMIGDSLGADVFGAQNAGIFAIWLTRRAEAPANRAHSDTIHPDAVIDTLAELPALFAVLEN
jgi:HAD superfamily hydrolase (TIGR01549 family)